MTSDSRFSRRRWRPYATMTGAIAALMSFVWFTAVIRAADVQPASTTTRAIRVDSAADVVDVTAALRFAPANDETAPFPQHLRPVTEDAATFERYGGAYWFELDLTNPSDVPVRRLLEITHQRLTKLVGWLRADDTSRALIDTGKGLPGSSRPISSPNAVIPFDLPAHGNATLRLYAASPDNMVFSARLWSEAGFSRYSLRQDLVVGAGLGALIGLGVYNLVVFLITRAANYVRLSVLLLAIAAWQIIGRGYADLLLWPDTTWLTAHALPAVMGLGFWSLLAFGRGFLGIASNDRMGNALRISQHLCAGVTLLMFCWPEPRAMFALIVVLTPSALLLLAYASSRVATEADARRFIVATAPLIVTMVVAAGARAFGASFEVGTVQSLILLSSVFLAVVLAIALAQHIQSLSSDRRDAHHAALVAKLRAKESELKADLAEQDNRAKTSFLATMSHEIRTPMNGILGMAELLRNTPLDEQQSYYIATLKRSGEALMSILNDVLDYSKAEAGRMEIEIVPVDLLELLDDVNVLYREHFRRKSLDFYVFVELGVPLRFKSDPTRLKQIVGNIVNNAVKFTERGRVTIAVRRHPERSDVLEFAVEDTGIGIAPEHAKLLFDRFRQADSSISRRYGGTGLGLAISKRLVELLGGDIRVETEPGVGTTFVFTIRTDIVEHAEPDPIAQSCVFMVTDDDALARSAGLVLERWVARFVAVADIDALTAYRPTHRDVVILDETCVEADDVVGLGDARIAWIGEGFDGTTLARPVLFAQLERLLRPAGEAAMPSDEARPLEHVGVLVAEDNRTNRLVVGKMLNSWGATVHFAENGEEAVEMFGSHGEDIDVVLMDCEMPEMDGYSATRHIRTIERAARRVTTPIIALTAHAMPEFRRRAEEAGMTDYVTKPIQKSTLLKAMLTARDRTMSSASDRTLH